MLVWFKILLTLVLAWFAPAASSTAGTATVAQATTTEQSAREAHAPAPLAPPLLVAPRPGGGDLRPCRPVRSGDQSWRSVLAILDQPRD